MAYSSNKPYQRTAYRKAADRSYDRHLKDAINAGKAENIKESMLEKPYNVKTYSTMQQEYNPVTPPVIDPGFGTGGLECIWTATDCEQLVGCWAGSDIVLEGPEAATAGYLPTVVIQGEIVTETISGSEDRGIDFVLNPETERNTFEVAFKDALGNIHKQLIDIDCAYSPVVTTEIAVAQVASSLNNYVIVDSTNVTGYSVAEGGRFHLFFRFANVNIAQGTTIVDARIEARSSTYYGSTFVTVGTYIELTDGSLSFNIAGHEDMSLRSWTGTVGWTINAFSGTTQVDSPSLTSLVQTIVNRPGWAANHALGFLLECVSNEDGDLFFPSSVYLVIES